jgi:RNA polymerase sigma factor (sigma-70 family)
MGGMSLLKLDSRKNENMCYKQQRENSVLLATEPADGILLRRSLTGDEDAFEALVSRYRSPLLRYINRILKDEEQANDILQFVFLRFYISLPTLQVDMPLKPWLFQVAYHRCIDELRRQRCRPSIRFSELSREGGHEGIAFIESIEDPQPSPEEVVEQLDLQAILHQAIGGLPPKFRSVVRLRCFGHLSFSEIGHLLKMPEATTKTYYYRGLRYLRSILVRSHMGFFDLATATERRR